MTATELVSRSSSVFCKEKAPAPAPVEVALKATHFFLYLNQESFMGEAGRALGTEVRTALRGGLPIALIHERDRERGACEFGTFFQSTPEDLIDKGVYRKLAIAFATGSEHRLVSYAMLAHFLGGKAQNKPAGLIPRSRSSREHVL